MVGAREANHERGEDKPMSVIGNYRYTLSSIYRGNPIQLTGCQALTEPTVCKGRGKGGGWMGGLASCYVLKYTHGVFIYVV